MLEQKLSALKELIILCVSAALIGVIVGALDAVFGRVLLAVTDIRMESPYWLLPFLPAAGGLMMLAFMRWGKNSIKGMGLVFQVRFDEEDEIPLRLIPFAILSTWATHLFGGSAGREGVAIQLGAAVGHGIGRRMKTTGAGKILLFAGMSAGFAGLFGTPVAAVFFALEVTVVGAFSYEALLPALTAAFTAAFVAGRCGLEKFTVPLEELTGELPPVDGLFIARLILCAIVFGAAGTLFAVLLKKLKELLGEKIKSPIVRIIICGAVTAVLSLLFFAGRYSGLGTNLIAESFQGGGIHVYDWLLKLLFTVFTLAAGFQGGEVTPLFAIGASLGTVLGVVCGLPVMLMAALGYAAVFAAATNTLIAPVFIGAEVFGFAFMPYFFVVCAIARIVSGSSSIYGGQRRNAGIM